jgi:hypothetical protein
VVTLEEIKRLLRERVDAEGGIVRFSVKHNISMGYLTNVLYRWHRPGPKILAPLGLIKATRYEHAGPKPSVPYTCSLVEDEY